MKTLARLLLALIIALHGAPLSVVASACDHCRQGNPCESGHCPKHGDGDHANSPEYARESGHVHGAKAAAGGGHDHCASQRGRCELRASHCSETDADTPTPTDPIAAAADSIAAAPPMTAPLRGSRTSPADSLPLAPPDPPPIATDIV